MIQATGKKTVNALYGCKYMCVCGCVCRSYVVPIWATFQHCYATTITTGTTTIRMALRWRWRLVDWRPSRIRNQRMLTTFTTHRPYTYTYTYIYLSLYVCKYSCMDTPIEDIPTNDICLIGYARIPKKKNTTRPTAIKMGACHASFSALGPVELRGSGVIFSFFLVSIFPFFLWGCPCCCFIFVLLTTTLGKAVRGTELLTSVNKVLIKLS